ncbi:MAG: amidohydrolase, partial [Armatimonadota bacterium]|nr:amidohydrolase [Armatimonadota bacterium]
MNQPSRIIDADVHNTYASPKDLLPYLSSYWQDQVKRLGLPTAALTVRSPIGVSREDARPDSGGPA